MMTQQGILEEVIGRLAELGIPYALTGSYASTYWGRPRSTHGIDMVVLIDGDQARRLANVVGPDYYADAEAMAQAAATAGHFNLIHYETGVKIDFWISRDEGYDEERFSRRVAPDQQRPELVVLAAEDVILSKLLWIREGAGGHQVHDILGILHACGPELDRVYLEDRVDRLGLSAGWAQVLAEAGEEGNDCLTPPTPLSLANDAREEGGEQRRAGGAGT